MSLMTRSETPRSPWSGILLGCCLALVVIVAWEATNSHASYMVTVEKDSSSGTVREILIRDGRSRYTIETRGEIEVASDERRIERLGESAYLTIEEKRGRERRRFEATPGVDGRPEVSWFVDRQPVEFDDDGQKWLVRVLRKLYRTTGHGAEQRVERLLAQGGVSEVLSEISKIGNDGVARLYFEFLLVHGELNDDELASALRQMARELGSDRELSQLILGLPMTVPGNPATADAWRLAVRSISSDYELRQTLTGVLEGVDLESRAVDALLEAASEISNDFELASFLVDVAEALPPERDVPDSYAQALSKIGSDFERRKALSAAIRRPGLDHDQLDGLLQEAVSIGSDFELAELLVMVASSYPGEPPEAYFRALSTIGSDHELHKALAAVVERPGLSDSTVGAVLEASLGIGSDHELSSFLRQLATAYTIDQRMRPAFDRALRTIGSTPERERVLEVIQGHS